MNLEFAVARLVNVSVTEIGFPKGATSEEVRGRLSELGYPLPVEQPLDDLLDPEHRIAFAL